MRDTSRPDDHSRATAPSSLVVPFLLPHDTLVIDPRQAERVNLGCDRVRQSLEVSQPLVLGGKGTTKWAERAHRRNGREGKASALSLP